MEVFLIPVGPDRYELYCEVADEDPTGQSPDHDRGFFRGLRDRFRETLASIERDRRHPRADDAHEHGFFGRLKERALRRIAESIAEQRLLWHMRRQEAATAIYPADLPEAGVLAIVRRSMEADFEKHRRWLIVNVLLFVLSGLLILVPGPNVLAYYFAFRLVGHYLSMRGARQALDAVNWDLRSSEELAELRPLTGVDQSSRRPRVDAIAARLQLDRLTHFFDRVAVPGA
jgi:hypothetical protein